MPIQDDGNKVLEGLDQCTVFYVRIPSVSGIVKLREDSVPSELRKSMPKELFSLEARVFGREAIRVPSKLTNRVRSKLTRIGTPFLSGYLVAKDHEDEARHLIEDCAKEYEQWVQPFLDKIDPLIAAQCDKFPAWAEMIRRAAPTREEVERKLTFRKSSFQVCSGSEQHTEDLKGELNTLPQQIAQEFSALVEHNWTGMHSDKTSQRFRAVLTDIRRKAKSLSYLHPKLRDLVDLIDQVMERIPAVGVITGADYALLWGLRQMLLDPSEILGEQRVLVAQFSAAKTSAAEYAIDEAPAEDDQDAQASLPPTLQPVMAPAFVQAPQSGTASTDEWVI